MSDHMKHPDIAWPALQRGATVQVMPGTLPWARRHCFGHVVTVRRADALVALGRRRVWVSISSVLEA